MDPISPNQPISPQTKCCAACFLSKPLDEFSKQFKSRDGFKNRCKICDKRYYDDYYARNSNKIVEGVKKWQSKNTDLVLRHKQTYRDKKKP